MVILPIYTDIARYLSTRVQCWQLSFFTVKSSCNLILSVASKVMYSKSLQGFSYCICWMSLRDQTLSRYVSSIAVSTRRYSFFCAGSSEAHLCCGCTRQEYYIQLLNCIERSVVESWRDKGQEVDIMTHFTADCAINWCRLMSKAKLSSAPELGMGWK